MSDNQSDPNSSAMVSNYGAALEDDRLLHLRRLTHILYALYVFFWLTGGVSVLIAIIINYVKRDDVAGTPYAAHFDWQIRTFWWSVVWGALGGLLLLVVVGVAILWVLGIWALYRIIRGWFSLYDNKPLPTRRGGF